MTECDPPLKVFWVDFRADRSSLIRIDQEFTSVSECAGNCPIFLFRPRDVLV